MKFTLGLAQCRHPEDGDVTALVATLAARAREAHVDLLVFPESLMTRFEEEAGAFRDAAQPLDGPFCRAIDATAAAHSLWLAYTVNEANPAGGLPFNTAVITNALGERQASYRKVHLFDAATVRESSRMAAGDAPLAPVPTPFGRIGLGICYDLRFPEVARAAALAGAQLMLYPAAWVDGPGKARQWQALLTARAIENGMYVAGVSRCDAGYVGSSLVVSPTGEVVATAGGEPTLLVAHIDTALVESTQAAIPVLDFYRRQGASPAPHPAS